jgi:hypothetical protein
VEETICIEDISCRGFTQRAIEDYRYKPSARITRSFKICSVIE